MLDTASGTYGVSSTFFDRGTDSGGAVGITASGLPEITTLFLDLSVPQPDLSAASMYDLGTPITIDSPSGALQKTRDDFTVLLDDGRTGVSPTRSF